MTTKAHHEKPNLRWDALTPTIITTTLATAVVILRLIVRCKFVKAVGFDDFVILVSLVGIFSAPWYASLDPECACLVILSKV